MRKYFLYFFFWFVNMVIIACHHKTTEKGEEEVTPEQVQTPVTVTSISNEPLAEYAELNATSIFQQDKIKHQRVHPISKHQKESICGDGSNSICFKNEGGSKPR